LTCRVLQVFFFERQSGIAHQNRTQCTRYPNGQLDALLGHREYLDLEVDADRGRLLQLETVVRKANEQTRLACPTFNAVLSVLFSDPHHESQRVYSLPVAYEQEFKRRKDFVFHLDVGSGDALGVLRLKKIFFFFWCASTSVAFARFTGR